jgi:hypothetical protein
MRRYHLHSAFDTEEAGNFWLANFAGPDNQAPPSFEFEEEWE